MTGRFLVGLACIVALMALSTGADAAVIWNSSASVQSTTNTTISNINSGSGAPNSNRITIQETGTGTTGTAVIRFNFAASAGVSSNLGGFALVTDFYNRDWSAQITAVNGTSLTGTVVNVTAGSASTDEITYLPVDVAGTIGGSTAVTSVDVTFSVKENSGLIRVDTFGTPEPGTFLLFGIGLAGAWGWSRRKRRQKSA